MLFVSQHVLALGHSRPNEPASFSYAHTACEAGSTRPLIAFLLSGNLRSFADPRVYRSVRHHLIDGLGGNSTVFIHGKRLPERWARGYDLEQYDSDHGRQQQQQQQQQQQLHHQHARPGAAAAQAGTSEEELREAIRYLSLNHGPHVVAQFVAASGGSGGSRNNATSGESSGNVGGSVGSVGSGGLLNPNCSWPDVGLEKHKVLPVGGPGATALSAAMQQQQQRAHARDEVLTAKLAGVALAYVGQLHSVSASFELMLAYERAHAVRFDRVARVRLDALWWHSAPPWCFLSPSAAYSHAADHFWLIPRDHSESVFLLYRTYLLCGNADGVGRHHLESNVAVRCCGGGPTALYVGAMRRLYPIRSEMAVHGFNNPNSERLCPVPLKSGSMVQSGLWGVHLLRVAHSPQPTGDAGKGGDESRSGASGRNASLSGGDGAAAFGRGQLASTEVLNLCRNGYTASAEHPMAVFPDVETCYRALRPAFETTREDDDVGDDEAGAAKRIEKRRPLLGTRGFAFGLSADVQCEAIDGTVSCW